MNLQRKNESYLLSVSDTGPGIPREAQARVFERFFRLERTDGKCDGVNSTGAGAGLGLSIAQSVAKAHGGSLSLGRSDSSGSTFIAVLPMRPPGVVNKSLVR